MYYIYHHLNKDNTIIYVGKTRKIIDRQSQHLSNASHISNEHRSDISKIKFMKLNSRIDMDILELHYINKYKPIYNSQDKINIETTSIEIKNRNEWITYTPESVSKEKHYSRLTLSVDEKIIKKIKIKAIEEGVSVAALIEKLLLKYLK